jgi:hypothetical protein
VDVAELLRGSADDLVNGAAAELHQARLAHYEAEGVAVLRERLRILLDLTLRCLESRQAEPINDWARRMAHERFAAGYDLLELQTAVNVLEESLWKRILSSIGPEDLAHALGLVNAILGMAKDTLARTYVSLATKSEPPAVNFKELFRETEGG